MGSMSMALPAKKPAWQAEKNLLYEFLGATKNPSGQLKLRGKVEVDRLELKCKLTLPTSLYAGRESMKEGISETLIGPWSSSVLKRLSSMGRSLSFPSPVKWGNSFLPVSPLQGRAQEI